MIRKIKINDHPKELERNERHVMRVARRNNERPEFTLELEAFEISKKGAQRLCYEIGEDGLRRLFDEEITSTYIKNRYNLEEARLCDIMDVLPCYGSIILEIEIERIRYRVVLVKESVETPKQLATFRIPDLRIRMSFND